MSTETSGAFGESLSPAEQAYFSSKGADTSALTDAPASETPEPVETPSEAPRQDAAQSDDDTDGIYIDENGKARSVVTGKFVPHGAFHKERERRKAAETEIITYREKMARADERLAVLNEIIAAGESPANQSPKKAPEPVAPPDPETDIFGYVKWQAEKIKELEQTSQQHIQRTERQLVANEVQAYYKNDAINFMKSTPDFADAYQYVANSYANELRAKGANDQQIQAQLMQEEAAIAFNAMRTRSSPSQVIYEMARARGWTPKGNTPQAAPSVNAQQKIDTIKQAQRTTPTLSGAGAPGGEGLTVEMLANMSEEEFASMSAKLGKSKMRQLLGG